MQDRSGQWLKGLHRGESLSDDTEELKEEILLIRSRKGCSGEQDQRPQRHRMLQTSQGEEHSCAQWGGWSGAETSSEGLRSLALPWEAEPLRGGTGWSSDSGA
jgi:hypothetical protein